MNGEGRSKMKKVYKSFEELREGCCNSSLKALVSLPLAFTLPFADLLFHFRSGCAMIYLLYT